VNSPFITLAGDELRRNFLTPWLLVSTLVLGVGGWSAISLGEREQAELRDTYAELVQARLQAQLASPVVSGRTAEPALRILRPPNPGAILVQGYDRSLPLGWEFAPAGTEALSFAGTTVGTSAGATWDIEVMTRLVGGLLAVSLGVWGALADRRSAWIDALMALPVSPHVAASARLLAGCATLAIVTIIWWLFMSAAIWWRGFEPELLSRLWLLAPVSFVSLVAMFGLATALAWTIRSEFVAAVCGVGLWATVGVLGPTAIYLIVNLALPAAPEIRMERERRQQYDDALHATRDSVAQQLGARVPLTLTSTEQIDVAEREFPAVEPEWQRGLINARRDAVELEVDWRRQKQNQQRLASVLSWLSPGTLGRDVLAELAGTGLGDIDAWTDEIGKHTAKLNATLFDNRPIVNLSVPFGTAGAAMMFRRHPSPDLASLPQFWAPHRDSLTRLSAAAVPFAGLFAWAFGALLIAHVASVIATRTGRSNLVT
jgi:ABC-type transport system involved in multi-copper enzyme maturation permease subunit